VKWQNKPPVNGREVEAKDIVYTLKSITGLQYPDLPSLRFPRKSQLEDMEDAIAVDKYTVKVKMKNLSAVFLDGLAEYRSPLTPDQVREALGGRDALATPSPDTYLSAGPYLLTSFKDTVEGIYTRYPDYWEKGEDGQSKPYLDQVRVIWVAEAGTQNAAFIAGQLSYLSLANSDSRNQITGVRKDAQIFTYSPSSCWYRLAMNMTHKPFDDVRVRKAIALVLDPVETGKTMWGDDNGKPLWRYPGPLPWSFPEAIPQEELAKLPFYESPKSQKTIDEAKRLMAEAGYADGFSFEMIGPNSSSQKDAMTLYTAQINKVFPNIKIKNAPIDGALQLERAAAGNFDAQGYCYIHEPTAVAMMKTPYHSKGGRNVARLNDPKMDELLDKAGQELDEAKRTALLREAQWRVFDLVSIMPTTHNASQIAFQPEFRGIRLGGGTLGYAMYSKDIWIDK
jgi:ABC-type transport system substrate-binding protein